MIGISDPQTFFIPSDNPEFSQYDENSQLTLKAVKETLKKIIKGSAKDIHKNSLLSRFEKNIAQGRHALEININDFNFLNEGRRKSQDILGVPWDDIVAFRRQLLECPLKITGVCDEALQEIYTELKGEESPAMQCLFSCDADTVDSENHNVPIKKIRDLKSNEVEKMVIVQGIVVSIRKSDLRKARKLFYRCRTCDNEGWKIIPYGCHSKLVPRKCEGEVARRSNGDIASQKCGSNSYRIVPELCTFIDEQCVKLQELPEEVPIGEMPRQIHLQLNRYLVDQMNPGNRVVVVGALECKEMGKNNTIGTRVVKLSYLNVLGCTITQGQKGARSFTEEEEERMKQMAKDPKIRQKIFDSIAPSIMPSEKDCVADIKIATACLLFGGRTKNLPDKQRMRGDINILLIGDPSVAKSQFLKFISKCAPISVYTSGKGSSAAGLTAAIIKDNRTGSFQLEGGAMVLADGGVVCIDEFDKMRNDDRVAIHEAMEQQTISIAKAGITVVLNTRCSVMAAANPMFGSYDELSSTADQIDFAASIMSRFDLIFLLRDVREEKRDFALGMHIISLHEGTKGRTVDPEFSVMELKKYISYTKEKCKPVLSEDASAQLEDMYIEIRQKIY